MAKKNTVLEAVVKQHTAEHILGHIHLRRNAQGPDSDEWRDAGGSQQRIGAAVGISRGRGRQVSGTVCILLFHVVDYCLHLDQSAVLFFPTLT